MASRSKEFLDYCAIESIRHIKVTDLRKVNGQAGTRNRTIILVISKLSSTEPMNWWKYVDKVQQVIHPTFYRSNNSLRLKLMLGTKVKQKEDLRIKQTLEEEVPSLYEKRRHVLREVLLEAQEENKK
ncbi:hypothetical protein ILUMI_21002 [Ignelater luminosus]|uniref:Uncharacterized protein n=1 Tax=Ignelater luminosus TaxID=2038154 RepID=A0A8K0CHD5_IGNLU|nr:hypothetical protein ILUMI_21002 [Ignelater luminosus]